MTTKAKTKPKTEAPPTCTVTDLHALADRLDVVAMGKTYPQPHRRDLALAVAVIRTALGDMPAGARFTLMNFGGAP